MGTIFFDNGEFSVGNQTTRSGKKKFAAVEAIEKFEERRIKNAYTDIMNLAARDKEFRNMIEDISRHTPYHELSTKSRLPAIFHKK